MREKVPALLATADGEVFRGNSVGGPGVANGEAVFNTSMTGYQEILTDPSYAGQIVVMTYPHIGNYGVVEFDAQSSSPAVSGFIMRSLSRRESSWRSEGSLGDYLLSHDVVAVSEVDTRRLTRHIRDRGAMPIAMGSDVSESELIAIAADTPTMAGQDLASSVTTREPYRLDAEGDAQGLVVAIDLGLKREILRNLTGRGFEVVVVPAATDAETILGMSPSGVFVSNGPGDPEPLTATTKSIRDLLGQRPLLCICLGHQVLGLAVGASTFKLPFGHHGGNHPVRRLDDNRVYITTQNHGFAVDLWSLSDDDQPDRGELVGRNLLPEVVETPFGRMRPSHQNLNDGTLEGMVLEEIPAFSVQYPPEGAPGPSDAGGLLDDFVRLMDEAG